MRFLDLPQDGVGCSFFGIGDEFGSFEQLGIWSAQKLGIKSAQKLVIRSAPGSIWTAPSKISHNLPKYLSKYAVSHT